MMGYSLGDYGLAAITLLGLITFMLLYGKGKR